MKFIAVLILTSFIALLTVGFMTMPEKGHHASLLCVVSTLDKATCSSQHENMALHHIGAYNSFTNILLSVFTIFILAIAFVAILFLEFFKSKLVFVPIFENIFTPQTTHLRRWLSRFINSPTFN